MATRNVAPRANNEGGIGTTLLKWATGFIKVLTVDTVNLLTLAKVSVGFTISGGDTSKTLTVDETSSMSGKENLANKSTNVVTDAASDTKYPSVKAIKDYADGLVVGLIDDRGNYNASGNAWPTTGGSGTAGAILKGDLWYISIAGTLGGVLVSVGSSIRALVDTPGSTAANWDILNVGLGYTPENTANRRTSFQATPDDTHYPSEKLTADSLAGKVSHSLATAENDVLVGAPTPFGSWVKKTLAEFKTIMGIASNVPAATAESDFMVSTSTPFAWVKKTLAEVKTLLGLGTAAYTASTAYDAAGTAAGKIASSISDGDTTHAPDANSVFDALALKQAKSGDGLAITSGKTITCTENTSLDEAVAMSSKGTVVKSTWIPVYTGSTGSIGATAYGVQSGLYTKIDRLVTVHGIISLSNNGDWTGDVVITGLPFSVIGDYCIGTLFSDSITYDGQLSVRGMVGTQTLRFLISKTASAAVYLPCSGVPDTGTLVFTLTYSTP